MLNDRDYFRSRPGIACVLHFDGYCHHRHCTEAARQIDSTSHQGFRAGQLSEMALSKQFVLGIALCVLKSFYLMSAGMIAPVLFPASATASSCIIL
jgi:hypothetical protein